MGIFVRSERSKTRTPEDERVAYNDRVQQMRKKEYPMLKGTTYLDHGGTTLASKSMLESFSNIMQATLIANPHSDAANPSTSSKIVAQTRRKVLELFNADPEHFEVIFTANTTAAVKLVMECFAGHEDGFDYYFHRNCHTSLVGVRELARKSHCFASDEETVGWLEGSEHDVLDTVHSGRPTLFAYPAQSNMNGQRLPLHWPVYARENKCHADTYTLLDAAAFVTTTPIDLSNHNVAPDFVALSFYKIFGFPDLGALIVRKASAHVLERRKYFGGGTTEMTTCFEEKPWVVRKEESIHARLEDGSIAIRSILALSCAIDTHQELFGGMTQVSRHTSWLAKRLYDRLSAMRHTNGVFVCHVYRAESSTYGDPETQGATIAINIRRGDGSWVSAYTVGAMLRTQNIHVRTGSLCNPAGMACALDLSANDIREAFDAGFRCNQEDDVRQGGRVFGMVRITCGAMSTLQDIETLGNFIESRFVDRNCSIRADSMSCGADPDIAAQGRLPCVQSHTESSRGFHKPVSLSKSQRVGKSFRKAILGCFS